MTIGFEGRTLAALLAACILVQAPATSAGTPSHQDREKPDILWLNLRLIEDKIPYRDEIEAMMASRIMATRLYLDAVTSRRILVRARLAAGQKFRSIADSIRFLIDEGPDRAREAFAENIDLPDEDDLEALALAGLSDMRFYEDASRYGQDLADLKGAALVRYRSVARPVERLMEKGPEFVENARSIAEKAWDDVPEVALDAFTADFQGEYAQYAPARLVQHLETLRDDGDERIERIRLLGPRDGLQTYALGPLGKMRVSYFDRWIWESPETTVDRKVAGLSLRATITPETRAEVSYAVTPDVTVKVHSGGDAGEEIVTEAEDIAESAAREAGAMALAMSSSAPEAAGMGEALVELRRAGRQTFAFDAGVEGKGDGALVKADRSLFNERGNVGVMAGIVTDGGSYAGTVAQGAFGYRANGGSLVAGLSVRHLDEHETEPEREVRFQAFYSAGLGNKREFSAGFVHHFEGGVNSGDAESVGIVRYRVTF
ncbi:MAG: hypothetical protein EOM26_12090 [Alphaproteobacteria bacterium]|nr:hypothetical protein [Alphaproteobacteria bacterium]